MLKNFFIFSNHQKQRLKKNISSQFGLVSAQVLIQFLFPPLMIVFWGVENFGIWILVTSIPATLNFLNINFSYAAQQEMTIFHTKKKFNKVNEIFQNNLLLTILNIIFFTIIIFLVYFFFSLEMFSALKNMPLKELNIILILIFLAFYLDVFNSILSSGISYLGKLYIPTLITGSYELILKLSIIFVGIIYDSLIYAAFVYLIINAIKTIVYFYFFIINNKILKFSFNLLSIKVSKRLFKLSIAPQLENITHTLKNSGQIFLFGLFFNPQIIAYVSTCKTLFYHLPARVIGIFNLVSFYEYAKLFASKKYLELENYHKKHTLFILMLLIILLVASAGLGKTIYNFWLSNQFNLTYTLLLVITLDAVFIVLKGTINITMKSINRFLKISIIEFCLISFSMFISFYLLNLGYPFITHFLIILVQTFIVLIITTLIILKFYKSLK